MRNKPLFHKNPATKPKGSWGVEWALVAIIMRPPEVIRSQKKNRVIRQS